MKDWRKCACISPVSDWRFQVALSLYVAIYIDTPRHTHTPSTLFQCICHFRRWNWPFDWHLTELRFAVTAARETRENGTAAMHRTSGSDMNFNKTLWSCNLLSEGIVVGKRVHNGTLWVLGRMNIITILAAALFFFLFCFFFCFFEGAGGLR